MNIKAITYAIQKHQERNCRYDGMPYSVHLAMVVVYAYKYIHLVPELFREDVIAACWCHDLIEDTDVTYNDLVDAVGMDIAEIVYAVTNEKVRTRQQRANEIYYEGIRRTDGAVFVKLCDRLANVRYSKETKSKMLQCYADELEKFRLELLPKEADRIYYIDMISELEQMIFDVLQKNGGRLT